MIVFLMLSVLVLLLVLSWASIIRETRRINIGGPFPLPVLGNAHLFIVKSTEFLRLLHRLSIKYGDAYRVHLFSAPYVILSHPKYIESFFESIKALVFRVKITLIMSHPVVSSSELITKGRSYGFLTCWLGQGLLTTSGQRWRTHRKFLTPAFHFNILQNFLPVFCKNQKILTEKLRGLSGGGPIDLFPIVALAALDNVTESVMGVSTNAQKYSESEYVKSIEEIARIVSMRMQIPFIGEDPIFNLLPYKAKQDKALKVVHAQSKQVIEARRAELNKLNITTISDSNDLGIKNKYAFLDLLLLAEIDGKRIDDESVREEVDTFMFEGHDTTTSGIVYTLFCLSKLRDVQEKIFEEQKTIFGDDMSRDPTYNELQQMKYLEMVIREAMRLYPPVPLIERLITKDCEVGDLKLIQGTSVTINIYQSQRHPDMFEDPLEFRPERHEANLKNAYSWLAFSAGPRNCIGQKFAMMELKVSISAVIKNFILLPSHIEPELSADLILRSKNGVHVNLIPRKFY